MEHEALRRLARESGLPDGPELDAAVAECEAGMREWYTETREWYTETRTDRGPDPDARRCSKSSVVPRPAHIRGQAGLDPGEG